MIYRTVKKSTTQGFTLIETAVVIGIYTVIMFAVTESVLQFYKYNAYAIAQAGQVDTARKGMTILVQDLREMIFADDGTFPLKVMLPHTVGFYSDIDRDNSVEYVEYQLASSTLKKRIYGAVGNPPEYVTTPESTHILSEYVQNQTLATSTFFYYNKNGVLASSTTNITDIVYIRAQIIVNIDLVRDPGQFMLRSSAALRNLKENI